MVVLNMVSPMKIAPHIPQDVYVQLSENIGSLKNWLPITGEMPRLKNKHTPIS
jgi:hypothetical protein